MPALLGVVVPVYQNERHLRELVGRLCVACPRVPDAEWRFVFVDDGSTDGSFELLARLATGEPRLAALRLARSFGADAAIRAGLGTLDADAVVVMAADLQDPPERIPELVARWREGAEVVLGEARGRRRSLDHPGDGFTFAVLDRGVCRGLASPVDRAFLRHLAFPEYRRVVVPFGRNPRMTARARWPFRCRLRAWRSRLGFPPPVAVVGERVGAGRTV